MGLAYFKDMHTLAEATKDLRMSGIYPAMLEAMDSHTLQAVSEFRDNKEMAGRGAALIFRVDSISDEGKQIVKNIMDKYHMTDVQLAAATCTQPLPGPRMPRKCLKVSISSCTKCLPRPWNWVEPSLANMP